MRIVIDDNCLNRYGGNGTTYDDSVIKSRLTALEAKPDNDKQTLSLEGNTLTILNGNSVTLPTQDVSELKTSVENLEMTMKKE